TAALVAVGVSLAVQVPLRGEQLREAAQATGRIADSHDRLRELVRDAGGRQALLRCGRLATSDVLVRTALAWELDLPLSEVVSFGSVPRLSGTFVIGPRSPRRLALGTAARADLLAARDGWRVYSLDCPAPASASAPASARSAGVRGALR
ncbi:MAG: hypothetical protein M3401_16860, partial [Actinomycetota bacterium]|nr:hypothetical protein [Actinomycetota bacterium]